MFKQAKFKKGESEAFRVVCERLELDPDSFDIEMRLELINSYRATQMVCVTRYGVRQVFPPNDWIDQFEQFLPQRLMDERSKSE